MTPPTVKERQHLAREEAILEVAHEVLAEQGYDKMNMDDLAKRVGIAKATLYQHFPSKEDLLVGVIVQVMRQGEALLMSEAYAQLPPLQRLEHGLRQGLLSRIASWDWKIVSSNPVSIKSNPRYCDQYRHLATRLITMLEEARARGDLNPALHPSVIAAIIIGLFQLDYTALRKLDDVTREQTVDTLVSLVINGLQTPDKPSLQTLGKETL